MTVTISHSLLFFVCLFVFKSVHILERKASSGSTDPSLSKQFLESDPISLSKVSKSMGCNLDDEFPSVDTKRLTALGHCFVCFYH